MDAATLASHRTRRRFVLDYEGYQIDLPPGELLVGRGAVCQLVLDDSLVSRRHAKLVVDDAGVIIEDLGSVNGVLVNQRRVVGQQWRSWSMSRMLLARSTRATRTPKGSDTQNAGTLKLWRCTK